MAHTNSISQRLHENLGALIASTPPGTRLPSEPALARELGVSRATLREAMRTFETQGLINRRQGSGTIVNQPASVIESGLEVLESIETLAQRINLPVSMGSLQIDSRLATADEALALGIEAGKNVISISRSILAENRPVAYLIDILPNNILERDEINSSFTGSVLDLLRQRAAPPLAYSRTEINAGTASHDIARIMEIQRGDVLLRFVAYLYSTDNQVIDYSYSYFLPGFFRFHVIRRVGII